MTAREPATNTPNDPPAAPEPTDPPASAPRKKAKKRRSWPVRIARAFGYFLLTILALVVGVLLFIHSSPGRDFVRKKLEARLGQRINGTLSIGHLDYRLGGDVMLGDVVIRDANGAEAIALHSLKVTPAWRRLLGGEIALVDVDLSGLDVTIVQDAEGGSNLRGLIKPQEEEGEKKPRHIVVDHLAIEGVNVTLTKPDGTHLEVRDVQVEASIDVHTGESTLTALVPKLALGSLSYERPGAIAVALTDLATGVEVRRGPDTTKVEVQPLTAHASLSLKDRPAQEIDLAWGGISLSLDKGEVEAALQGLEVGVAALEALEVSTRLEDGAPAGAQHAKLTKLAVRAERVNALLGKPILLSDVSIAIGVDGPMEALRPDLTIDTAGGRITLTGTADVHDFTSPAYDVVLTVSDLAPEKILRPELAKLPPLALKKLTLHAKGSGAKKETVAADITLAVEDLHVRDILIDGIDLDARFEKERLTIRSLKIRALEQTVALTGSYALADKAVDVEITLGADAGELLAKLREAGLAIKTELPPKEIVLREGDLKVRVKGKVDEALDIEVDAPAIAVAQGTIGITAKAKLLRKPPDADGKTIQLGPLDAEVTLKGINANAAMALLKKELPNYAATVDGKVHVTGTLEDPQAKLALTVTALPYRAPTAKPAAPPQASAIVAASHVVTPAPAKVPAPRRPVIGLAITGTASKAGVLANVQAGAVGADGKVSTLIELGAALPLSVGRAQNAEGETKMAQLDFDAPLRVKLALPDRRLADVIDLVPPKLQEKLQKYVDLDARVSADIDVEGTLANPHGHIRIDAFATAVGGKQQRVALDVKLGGDSEGHGVVLGDLSAWLDRAGAPALKARFSADLPNVAALRAGSREISWRADVEVPEQDLAELGATIEKLAGLSGTVAVRVELKGNTRGALGTADVTLANVHKGELGPIDAKVHVDLREKDTHLDARVKVAGHELVIAEGGIGIPGADLFGVLKSKAAPLAPLDLDVKIPLTRISGLSEAIRPGGEKEKLRRKLERMPGTVRADIDITGTIGTVLAKGEIRVEDVPVLDGTMGKAAIDLDANASEITATVGVGSPAAGAGTDAGSLPVRIDVDLKRDALTAYRAEEGPLAIRARVRSDKVDLHRLVPKFVLEREQAPGAAAPAPPLALDFQGTLDIGLEANVVLDKKLAIDGASPVQKGDIVGKLVLDAPKFVIPTTTRMLRDVKLRVDAEGETIKISTLQAREEDRERKDRTLEGQGAITLDKLKLQTADVRLTTKHWLAFGGTLLGAPDAPRGVADLDVVVHATDLSKPIRKIDVSIAKLELRAPDRFERAHQSEVVHMGDVAFVGDDNVQLGRLSVPESVAERARQARLEAVVKDPVADPPAPPPTPDTPQPPAGPTGLDLAIHIPNEAHVLLSPLDLYVRGDVDIQSRAEGGSYDGELTVTRGSLSLGGAEHAIERGKIYFDATCKKGCVDLEFAKELHPAVLRDVSLASAGDSVKIHMTGPLMDRKTVLAGAASPGTLFDLLSAHNAGHSRYVSEPDLPSTMTTQFPQHPNLLALAFLGVNLPHLLFLDRIAAWSDPYDDPRHYGEVRHVEAENFVSDDDVRVRGEGNPPAPGRSNAEVQVEYMLTDPKSRTLVGIGAGVGSRLGGGPGISFEWWSSD